MSQKAFKFALVAVQSAALLALFAAPARAQNLVPGFQLGGDDKQLTPEEKERNAANEKAAKDAQRSIAAPKVSNDPWGDVRAAETPKTAKSKKVQ
ncbi:MAG: hypothetical protein K2X60_07150 [Xanthobacteraceae bacterium]|nr:hypothetical protein [Xanthobacteraceae bacterium]